MSGYVAEKLARRKVEGVFAPLLDAAVDSSDEGSSDDESDARSELETVRQTPLQKLKSIAAVGGLVGGAAASVAAMALAPGPFTFLMGGVCLANVPYALAKERQIGALPALRALNHRLKEDADRLEEEVDVLADEIDALQPEAHRAAAAEEALRAVAESQSVNVQRLVELVRENEVVLSSMRDNLRRRVMQDIIGIVMRSDGDRDETLDPKEVKLLALRIRIALQEDGVLFDSDKFLQVFGGGTTVTAILALVERLLPMERRDDDDDDDALDVAEGDVYDMFHMVPDRGAGDAASDASTASGGQGVSLVTTRRPSMSTRRLASVTLHVDAGTLQRELGDGWDDY